MSMLNARIECSLPSEGSADADPGLEPQFHPILVECDVGLSIPLRRAGLRDPIRIVRAQQLASVMTFQSTIFWTALSPGCPAWVPCR